MAGMVGGGALPVVKEDFAVAFGGADVRRVPRFLAARMTSGLVWKAFLPDLPAIALSGHPEIPSNHEAETGELEPSCKQTRSGW